MRPSHIGTAVMPMRAETISLQYPDIAALPRAEDQITFLHLFAVKVSQDDTGVLALDEDKDGRPRKTYLPIATIAAILLGPGSSISQAALSTITRHGTVIIWTGQDASRTHGWAYSLTSSARWAEAQATLWANPDTRINVAVEMYKMRFGDLPPGKPTLARLRGLEGQRMKQTYRMHASKNKVAFKRSYQATDYDDSDPVNQALSSANAALYGVSLAGIVALGCHPGLGFIHSGNINAFVHDIADLHKAEISIPAAFRSVKTHNPGSEARRLVRESMVRANTLGKVVSEIQSLLKDGLRAETPKDSLINEDGSFVPSHTDYSNVGIKEGVDEKT